MNEIVIILILILLNGIFSMSEIAIISSRKPTLRSDERKGSKSARAALRLAEDPGRFLSTVQIGITLIGILTGIYSGATLADKFASLLTGTGIPAYIAHPTAQALIVAVVTYLTIIFGELVPKRIGMGASERMAKIIARPMLILSRVAGPFVWVLSQSTKAVMDLLGMKGEASKVTEEDIRSIIQEGRDDGEVQEMEQDIVERVFAMDDLKVCSLMTHRSEMASLDISMDTQAVKRTLAKATYEQYPVTDGDMDKILGVVRLKDLIVHFDDTELDLKAIMQPPVYFYENMSVYKALEQMKEKSISQALICYEFGSLQGIVTLRDILEGLVGNINGTGNEPDIIEREDGKSWLIDGQCPFYDFLAHFDREDLFDKTQGYTTLAGLIIEHMKRIPRSGDSMTWNGFRMEIVDMDGARIDKVMVSI